MARVATNYPSNRRSSTEEPYMDRLSHAVIKETSKNLKHYLDVKRRENGFVLNPNSTALDSSPLRTRLLYGTAKGYPPLYGSCYTDNDIKIYLHNFKLQQRRTHPISNSPEKRMCRKELNYHMRSNRSASKENQKFAELRLRPSARSSSSCNITTGREVQRGAPRSAFKSSRYEQNQMIDDTATILASMIKTRRSVYDTYLSAQQTPHAYDSRNTNPSPRPTDEQPTLPPLSHPPVTSTPPIDQQAPKKEKRTTKNALEKSISIMREAKPMTKGLLCEYKVSVTTGNCNGASTDAPIRIQFYGTNGHTPLLDLINSETYRVPFSKNQTDVFTIETYHVGQLAGISIGHDRKDIGSGWFLDKVVIVDPIRHITSDIPCNAWLSSKSSDQKTMRDFPVVSMVPPKKQVNSYERRDETSNYSDSSAARTDRTTPSDTSKRNQHDEIYKHKRTKKQHKRHRPSVDSAAGSKRSPSPTQVLGSFRPSSPVTNKQTLRRNERFSLPPPASERPRSHSPPIHPTLRRNERFSPVPRATLRPRSRSPPIQPTLRRNESFSDGPLCSPSHSPIRQRRSPPIQPTSSSDTEIEDKLVTRSPVLSPTPLPTFDRTHIRPVHYQSPSPTTDDTIKHYPPKHDQPSAHSRKYTPPKSVSPEQPMKSKETTSENDELSFFD